MIQVDVLEHLHIELRHIPALWLKKNLMRLFVFKPDNL